jgi:selenocysteine lyase/cysteine desulfurase
VINNMTDYSCDFTLDPQLLYLNHAAVSPWPVETCEILHAFINENGKLGASQYPQWLKTELTLRKNIARLINAPSSEDVALVKNTSEALSFVAYGLSWTKGDNIVLARDEFPSNRIVWQSLKTQGVDIRWVDLTNVDNTKDTPEDRLINAIDEHTRLLSVSSVQYGTGLKMDLEKLGRACNEQNILFCVDAIQSIGAFAFDVQGIKADFVMADGHKWLMSPEGLGLFYCSETIRSAMHLTQYGWHMTQNPSDYDALDWQTADSARKFECGSPNMLGVHALNRSIELILKRKVENISKAIVNNSIALINKLEAIPDIKIISNKNIERISGIVSFRHNAIASEYLYQELMKNRVICAMRQGNVRFSPHYYTSKKVIDGAIEILKKIIANNENKA